MPSIFHIPLVPISGDEGTYRASHEYYEADAEDLREYVQDLLAELNETGDGVWRPVRSGDVHVVGLTASECYVIRGEYPGEPPMLVAYIAK